MAVLSFEHQDQQALELVPVFFRRHVAPADGTQLTTLLLVSCAAVSTEKRTTARALAWIVAGGVLLVQTDRTLVLNLVIIVDCKERRGGVRHCGSLRHASRSIRIGNRGFGEIGRGRRRVDQHWGAVISVVALLPMAALTVLRAINDASATAAKFLRAILAARDV